MALALLRQQDLEIFSRLGRGPLLSLLNHGPDVESPGVVCRDVGVQKLEGGDSFHLLSIYEERGVVLSVFLKSMISPMTCTNVNEAVVSRNVECQLFLGHWAGLCGPVAIIRQWWQYVKCKRF